MDSTMYLLLRTKVPPLSLSDAVTRTVWASDPEQSTFSIMTMETRVADTIWQRRLSGALFLVFAALALILAAVGIYGVMSYAVSQRTREIGIRLAMGARTMDVLKLILSEGLKLMLLGSLIGIIASLLLTQLMASLLYGVKPYDPLTLVVVSLLLAVVAFVACFIPARRATKVDPMVALRYE